MTAKQTTKERLTNVGLAIIRLLAGGIIFSFGLEIFDRETLVGYTTWLGDVGVPFPAFMAYLGKVTELVGGACLVLGLLTRWAAALLMIVMFVVTFIMTDGNVRSESFYLLLVFACFLVSGSGQWSLDQWRTDIE